MTTNESSKVELNLNPAAILAAGAYSGKTITQLRRIARRALADVRYADTGARRYDPLGKLSPRSSQLRNGPVAAQWELAKVFIQLPQRNIGKPAHRDARPHKSRAIKPQAVSTNA